MFKQRKSTKQLRKKTAEEEITENQDRAPSNGKTEENAETSTQDTETEFVSIKQRKKQDKTTEDSAKQAAQKSTKPTLLSFDSDEIAAKEEKETSKTQDAKPKRKLLMTGMIAVAPAPALQAASKIYSAYTPEMLQKLKEGTKAFPPAKANETKSDANDEEELIEDEVNDQMQDMDVEEKPEDTDVPPDAKILNTDQVETLEMAEDEEDEDYQRWEREQIKKGGGGRIREVPTKKASMKKQVALLQLTRSTPMSVEEVTKKLRSSLRYLQDSHDRDRTALMKANNQIETAEENLKELEKDHKSASEDYVYFQELREYLADLTDCLGEKAPMIEDIEEQLLKLDVDYEEQKRKRFGDIWDEIPDEKLYLEQREILLRNAEQVFADTSEEFSTIEFIKKKFEDLKFTRPRYYNQGYIAMSMPQLFAPFVRLEMLRWDPLKNPEFDKMKWYGILFDYGLHKDMNTKPPQKNDPDADLLLVLIGKVLVPKVTQVITHLYNPRLKNQTEILGKLIDRLLDYFEPSSESLKDLFSSLTLSLKVVVENLPRAIGDSSYCSKIIQFLSNACTWFTYIPETVQSIALNDLLNMRILPFLNVESPQKSLEQIEKIVQVLPDAWLKDSNRMLGLFHNFVVNFHKKIANFKKPEKQETVDRVVKVLQKLNDLEGAQKFEKYK